MNESTHVDENAVVNEGGSSAAKSITSGKVVVFIVIGIIAVIFVFKVLAGIYKAYTGNGDSTVMPEKVSVVSGPKTSDIIASPEEPVDEIQLGAIKEKHNKVVEESSGHRQTVVMPSISGVDVSDLEAQFITLNENSKTIPEIVEEPVVEPPPPPSNKGEKGKNVNPYSAQIEKLFSTWDKDVSSAKGVNLYVPEIVYSDPLDAINNDPADSNLESRRILKERSVDYLQVYPATLELGYNSDTGGLMIVSVHHPGLQGVKFQASTSVGAYNERAAITLSTGVLEDGTIFDVQAVVVDQKDRIPSVKGKVDRHLLYNTIFGFGTSLLDGFAQYSELDAGLVRGISIFPSTTTPQEDTIDSDGLIAANGAKSLSSSIKQLGEFRPNTLTTKPWKTVGVVFLPKS